MAQEAVDADIFEPLKHRDPAGLERCFDRYGALAFGLAMRSLGDAGRAEEVVQDVFLTLWKRPEAFDPARGSFRTWLLTMVRNRAIDSLRGRWRHHRGEAALPVDLSDSAPSSDPAAMVADRIESAVIRQAMNSLPPEQRMVIDLSYFEGYTHAEMAQTLNLPVGTVKGRLRLGMVKLHTYLVARGVALQ